MFGSIRVAAAEASTAAVGKLPSQRPCGLTDKASDFGSEDCRFESCHGRILFFFFRCQKIFTIFLIGEGCGAVPVAWVIAVKIRGYFIFFRCGVCIVVYVCTGAIARSERCIL